MNKSKLSLVLFGVMALIALAYAGEIVMKHSLNSDWPNHAKYHVMVSGIQIAVIALSSLLFAVRMTKDTVKQIWAPLALLSSGTVAAWPIARLVMHEPIGGDIIGFIIGAVVMVSVALYLSCKSLCNAKGQ